MPELRISDSDVQDAMGQGLRHGITKQLSEYAGPWDDIAKREIPNLQGQFRIKNGFDSSVGRVADGGTAYDGSPRLAQTATYKPEILGGKLNISWGTLEALRGDGKTANDEIEDNMEVLRDTFTFVASAQLISNQLGTVKTLVNVGASTFDMDSMGAIEVGLVLWIYASSATSASLPTHKLQVTQVSYVPMGTSTITFIDLLNSGSTLGVAIPAGSLIFSKATRHWVHPRDLSVCSILSTHPHCTASAAPHRCSHGIRWWIAAPQPSVKLQWVT